MSLPIKSEKELLDELDQLIKNDRLSVVHSTLNRLSFHKIPREFKYQFANIARRANMTYWSVKLLNPIIRSKKSIYPPASDDEIVSYAAGLIRLGNFNEGFELLSQVDSKQHPEVLFFKSLGLVNQWQYAESIPLLRQYSLSAKLSEYEVAIGLYNLASAYVYEDRKSSFNKIIGPLVVTAEKNKWSYLLANLYRLSAQFMFNEKNFSAAKINIKRSLEVFQSKDNLYHFFARKLFVFIDMYEKSYDNKSRAALQNIKSEAISRGHWETVRECDLYHAYFAEDQQLLNYLYFGTPYKSYRRRILAMTGSHYTPSQLFHLKSGSFGDSPARIHLNLPTGKSTGDPLYIEPGSLLHNGFIILLEDFYKPIPLGTFFSKLHAEEYFDPITSTDRVYKTIRRLRQWFKSNNLDILIEVRRNQFKLQHHDPQLEILIPLKKQNFNKDDLLLNQLRAAFQYKSFSTSQAAARLGLSRSTLARLLHNAVKGAKAYASGRGRSRLYRLQK